MHSRAISFGFAFTLLTFSASSIACSPPSDPTLRAEFFESLKGRYRFWAVVLGEESVTTKAGLLRSAATMTGLRVRILESAYAALPVSREFTFIEAAIGSACEPDYRSLSILKYPVGTEVQLGSEDLVGIRVLGFSRAAAQQCPEATLGMNTRTHIDGQIEWVAMPKVIPTGYSGCRYSWVRFTGSRAPLASDSTSHFLNGRLQWLRTPEMLCTYEAGALVAGKSFSAHVCPASEDIASERWRFNGAAASLNSP